MITNIERQQIQQLLQAPQWQTVERLAHVLIEQIRDQPSVGDTEWDTIKRAFSIDFEVRGIRRFLQECYNQALETK